MNRRIADLLRIVREETGIYRDLIEHARRKTSLLIQGRTEALLESNKIDETFSVKLRIMENEMNRLCSELCQEFTIPREEFTLLRLAEGVEPEVAEEIKAQAGLFKNLLEQLKKVTQHNMKLVESSLSYSRGLLDFVSNARGSYQGTGRFRPLSAIQPTISRQA